MLMRTKSSLERALGQAQTRTVIEAMANLAKELDENRCGGGAE